MINFRLGGDNSHICELQVAHNLMLSARKGLPGHVVYGSWNLGGAVRHACHSFVTVYGCCSL